MESAALTRRGLSAGALKVIAILAMTADHIAWLFFPGYPKELLPLALHLIGRITCPIMCFLIAEGFHHTHDIRRYTARLFLFALLSHFAYRFAFQNVTSLRQLLPFSGGDVLNQTSVIWSLAFGLVMLRIAADPKRTGAMQALLVMLCCAAALPADWSCIAALWILSIGTNRGDGKAQLRWCALYLALYVLVYFLFLDRIYALLQCGTLLAVPLLRRYDGTRSHRPAGPAAKWFFYLYYPAHLVLIGLLRPLVHG